MDRTDYLRNPYKWQASHPTLSDAKPEQLFPPDFVPIYQGLHRNLYRRILRCHGTIQILFQLDAFPFNKIYPPDDMMFWHLVRHNFFDTACLVLSSLVADKGSDVHTLASFERILIEATWASDIESKKFQDYKTQIQFGEELGAIRDKVKVLRDNRLAHTLRDNDDLPKLKPIDPVSIRELARLFEHAHILFGALTFGAGYATLAGDMAPSTVGGKLKTTCLDSVLDAVLKDSYFVSLPEKRGQWWESDLPPFSDPSIVRGSPGSGPPAQCRSVGRP